MAHKVIQFKAHVFWVFILVQSSISSEHTFLRRTKRVGIAVSFRWDFPEGQKTKARESSLIETKPLIHEGQGPKSQKYAIFGAWRRRGSLTLSVCPRVTPVCVYHRVFFANWFSQIATPGSKPLDQRGNSPTVSDCSSHPHSGPVIHPYSGHHPLTSLPPLHTQTSPPSLRQDHNLSLLFTAAL